MENYGEIDFLDFLRLMKAFVDGRIDAKEYQASYTEMTTRRFIVPSEDVDRILQQAYGDADDYDPAVRLPATIEEPELKRRVRNSIRELESLGHSVS